MLISRKPYCHNCQHRGSAWGPSDYSIYPCECGEEIYKLHPDKIINRQSEYGLYFVREKQRCPAKQFFEPIYTKEQQCKHNNHK